MQYYLRTIVEARNLWIHHNVPVQFNELKLFLIAAFVLTIFVFVHKPYAFSRVTLQNLLSNNKSLQGAAQYNPISQGAAAFLRHSHNRK